MLRSCLIAKQVAHNQKVCKLFKILSPVLYLHMETRLYNKQ